MEVWRAEVIEGRRPQVLSAGTFAAAVLLHLLFVLAIFLFAWTHGLFEKEEEEVIPIDLTVVVVENLDGNENEPPPMKKPEPPPPPPPPKPKPKPEPPKPKEPEPPKELEKIVTNVVAKVEKPKEEPKKLEEPKKPEEPKKTAQQLREERLKAMRERATDVKKTTIVNTKPDPNWKPQPNGRTDRKTLSDAEIQKLLDMGYKPGRSEQLATSDEQLGYSLIKMAFEAKWDKPAWTDTMKPMVVRVWFGGGGRVTRYVLEKSSGDSRADQTIKSAASRVGSIPTLPAAFVEKYRTSGVPVRFTVKPE